MSLHIERGLEYSARPSLHDLIPCDCGDAYCTASISVSRLTTLVSVAIHTLQPGVLMLTPHSARDLALVLQEAAADAEHELR